MCVWGQNRNNAESPAFVRNRSSVVSNSSMNASLSPSVRGQPPDPVNLVDSETGSYARAIPRLATSEEVLLSSQSYVSGVLDSDAIIPRWMFQSPNSRPSSRQAIPVVTLELPVELVVEDENGNDMVRSVGAGDGCGVHSDLSHDSSGRWESFDSSATSSMAQSESFVEPAVFFAEYESFDGQDSAIHMASILNREPSIDTSFTSVNESSNPSENLDRISSRISEDDEEEEYDVSSIDTDK